MQLRFVLIVKKQQNVVFRKVILTAQKRGQFNLKPLPWLICGYVN